MSEKIASSALSLYGHEGNFEIGFMDAEEGGELTHAFQALGCEVTSRSTKSLLTISVPTSASAQSN